MLGPYRPHAAGAFLSTLLLAACAGAPTPEPATPTAASSQVSVLEIERLIEHEWQTLQLRGRTDYRIVVMGGRPVIEATGANGASGLIRRLDVDVRLCPRLVWAWRVDELQADADLRQRDAEDVAASLFLLFGDPGFLADPEIVPTLRYVWTNARHRKGEVIDNPYLPGVVRSLVVRSGEERLRQWVEEGRDLLADYERAFGEPVPDHLRAVALFSDNDQTRQPVRAYYDWVRLECLTERESRVE